MMKRKKKKGFIYYFNWLLAAALLVVCGVAYGPKIYEEVNRLDIDKILAQSPLKNNKFDKRVEEIKQAGVSAYFMEEHSNPIVSVNFSFKKAGTAYEDEQKLGIGAVLSEMLLAGAGKYNELEFKELCAQLGIKLGFEAGKDNFSGWMAFPSKYKKEAAKLLHDAFVYPRFPDDYLDLIKQQILLAQKLQQERPERVLNTKFNEYIFAGHPYERNPLGSKNTVENVTSEDLRDYVQNMLTRDNLVVGIAGDMQQGEAEQFLQDAFGGLSAISETEVLPRLDWKSAGMEYNIARKSAQAISLFATKGTYRDSVDFYPLYVANYIFGESGLDSRLSKQIREKEGLTYGIYTFLSIANSTALIVGKYSSTPENFDKAKEILLNEWQNFAQKGVTAKELEKAKQSLINSYNLRFADINNISAMLTSMQLYNLGRDFLEKRNDYINELNLQEVNAAAKKYFSSKLDFVNIGKEQTEDK